MRLGSVERLSCLLVLAACTFDATGLASEADPTAGPTASSDTSTGTPDTPTSATPTTDEPTSGTAGDPSSATTTPLDTTSTDPTTESTLDITTSELDTSSSSGAPDPFCGDTMLDPDEECDDGNADNTDACVEGCKSATCGDGFVHAGTEDCDDPDPIICNLCTAPSCSDGLENGDEQEVDCGGSCMACPIASCQELKQIQPQAPSGVYTIDPDKGGPLTPFEVYCEQSAEGGGWTMVFMVDGRTNTFAYTSSLWSNTDLHDPDPELNRNETKLRSWDTVPLTELLVGFETPISPGGDPLKLKYIKLPAQATSTYALFSPSNYKPTTLGRPAWKGLIDNSSLQSGCNREGFNVVGSNQKPQDYARVRIGLLANDNGNCDSPNSYIGVGGGWTGMNCVANGTSTTGNRAGCFTDNGDRDTASFAVVFAR